MASCRGFLREPAHAICMQSSRFAALALARAVCECEFGAVCESSDGVICDEVRVSESGGGGLSAGAVAAIVIILLIIICIIGE